MRFFPQQQRPGNSALGRLPAGVMNKTEESYAVELENLRAAGFVTWWKFEAVKLRLADNTFYTPDFTVMLKSGELEMHEVKARWSTGNAGWNDDARVKIKVAASIYPFPFISAMPKPKKDGGGWEVERF